MISVSYLKSRYSKEETINKIEASDADFIHVDLMDGKYVPINNLDTTMVINDLKNINKKIDLHLMVENPLPVIKELLVLKPYIITIHFDIPNVEEVINYTKSQNILVGLAINPNQDINQLAKYLPIIDYVLVMGVTPGYGGQEFQESTIASIAYLQDKNVLIGLDGGVNDKMMSKLANLKIANLVSGSYICLSENFNENIHELKKHFSKI